jgi:hypothetical protein
MREQWIRFCSLAAIHPAPTQRLISNSLRPNGPALTFHNRPILEQNLLGSKVCEPTSDHTSLLPPGTLLRRKSGPARGIVASRGSNGANAMRSILALGVLIALCTSANAAKVHHSGPHHFQRRDVIVHPSQDEAAPSGWYKFPGYPPIPPDQNRNLDPSNFGGG